MWVSIIEKAWAKLHGSYYKISSGAAHLAFRDLTGAPGRDYSIDYPDLLPLLMEATE